MADTPAIPEDNNLDSIETAELETTVSELREEFTRLYDEQAPLAELNEIASRVEAIDAELDSRSLAAEAEAAERSALADKIAATAPVPAEEAEVVAEAEAITEEAAEVVEPVTASAAPSARSIARRTVTPVAPSTNEREVVITAAADVPGYSNGQSLDKKGIAIAMHARSRNLSDSKGQAAKFSVASIQSNNEFTIGDHDVADDVIRASVDSQLKGKDAAALVASGGWCAPSETLYEMFGVASDDGLLDLPAVGVSRGGLNVPSFVGIDQATAGLWTWTEATDLSGPQAITDLDVAATVASATVAAHGYVTGQTVTITGTGVALLDGSYVINVVDANTFSFTTTAADTTNATGIVQAIKQCLHIPCPSFMDYRLEAEGLCITNGNLMDRAFPEMGSYFVDLAVKAHYHRLSAAKIAKIVATATAVTVTTVPSDIAGDLLNAIDLQVADYRNQFLMGNGTVLDAVFPEWVIEAIRSTLAMRAGIDKLAVSNDEIIFYFTVRNIRPQFVANYGDLFSVTAATAWPATTKFLLYPTGGYVFGDGGTLDLGVVRDSVLNATNDFTAAWTEQFYTVIQRGPAAREVTVTTSVNGQTGGPEFVGA